MTKMDRRNFLKLAAFSSLSLLYPDLFTQIRNAGSLQNPDLPNIIFLTFDAMSARNLSVYGYPRPTSPNLERFAEHATVYHSHYAGGNFTSPGVSSLLTGTYPWTHRAVNQRGVVRRDLVENNIFNALGEGYTRLAFPQNFWVDIVLTQFEKDIDILLPPSAFSELDNLVGDVFRSDKHMATRALDDFIFSSTGQPTSLVFESLRRSLYDVKSAHMSQQGYPLGVPHDLTHPLMFRLDNVFNGLMSVVSNLTQPFFTYLHLLSPHSPYLPTEQFYRSFKDDMKFLRKPEHPLSEGIKNSDAILSRRLYDEYIASLDWEFGRFLNFLEERKFFENGYLIITSDHGEMFERGEVAHSTPLLYDPVVHIPLMISVPQQKKRNDIYSPTSAVDILPTLAHLTGGVVPARTEGVLLPGFDGRDDFERSIYVVEAKLSTANRDLKKATVVLRKGNQKLIYYTGYDTEDVFELYNLEDDIEELHDLYPQKSAAAMRMRDELLEAFHAANRPFIKQ